MLLLLEPFITKTLRLHTPPHLLPLHLASPDRPGVYKGLHLSSTTSPSTATPAPPTTTLTSTLLHPSTTSSAARNNNGTAHPANTTTNAAAATQVLLGNNSLRLGVPAGKRIHAPRTLGTTMSTSALKLAHAATANCQKPKVATASASPLDMVPR